MPAPSKPLATCVGPGAAQVEVQSRLQSSGRVTLAKWLLHAGPQFPHLYSGAAEEGAGEISKPPGLSAVEEGSRRAPRHGHLLPEAAWEIQPLSPNPASRSRLGQPGLAGGRLPEVCAPTPVLGKGERLDSRKLRKPPGLGWAPGWVDQHGRLWGRGNGVCWARAPLFPRAGRPPRCAG